jgi:flagellar assembly factor FliW
MSRTWDASRRSASGDPGTGFLWLHSVEDPALALPVVDPELFFSEFELALAAEDSARTGISDPADARIYVTVRATPDPLDITANLRAPLLILDGRGYQVINTNEHATLRAPLFVAPEQPPAREASSVDAA